MTKQEYSEKLNRIKRHNQQLEMKRRLRKEYMKRFQKFKLPSTSKLILWAVILLNFQIVWFVEKAMMQWGDFSATYALIGIPVAIVPVLLGYFSKSKAENTVGGIVHDTAMNQMNSSNNDINEDGSVG